MKFPCCHSQKLRKDPYATTLGGFAKVTNYIFDAFRWQDLEHEPRAAEESPDRLNEVIPGLEINQQEEPGFEVITRVSGPPLVRPPHQQGELFNALVFMGCAPEQRSQPFSSPWHAIQIYRISWPTALKK